MKRKRHRNTQKSPDCRILDSRGNFGGASAFAPIQIEVLHPDDQICHLPLDLFCRTFQISLNPLLVGVKNTTYEEIYLNHEGMALANVGRNIHCVYSLLNKDDFHFLHLPQGKIGMAQ